MDKNSSRCIYPGRDKAKATEIPPRSPPHVRIAMEFFSKALLNDKERMGMETDIHLANNTTGIAIILTHKRSPLEGHNQDFKTNQNKQYGIENFINKLPKFFKIVSCNI